MSAGIRMGGGDANWPIAAEAPRRAYPLGRLLLLALVALLIGSGATLYAVRRSPRIATVLHLGPRVDAPVVVPAAPPPAIPAIPAALGARLAAVELRVAEADRRTLAVTGNADRAEGLLVAFAARRALDHGVALGFLEGLLRQRFGGVDPQAVAAVIGASRRPVTLADLQAGLDAVRPQLSVAAPGASWFEGVRQELASLIVVRRADTPSAVPADRLLRASRQLEHGQVAGAMAEVARLPGRAAATAWLAEAGRYVRAHDALDRIETAALLRPEDLSAGGTATAAGAEVRPDRP